MLKAIKVRLYLNNEQTNLINSLLGSYRFVYNQCLAYKKLNYETDKKNTSLSDLGHYFKIIFYPTLLWFFRNPPF